MTIDSHLTDAAQRVRDHVADYPVPALDPGQRPARPLRTWAPTAVFAVLVLLLGGVVAVAGGADDDDGDRDGDGDVAGPELVDDDAVELLPDQGTEDGGGIAVAGPRDGKDSLQLPVEVSPSSGLADGEVVTVSGSQFPPGEQLGIVMCAVDGPAGPGAGVDNCDIGTVEYVYADAEGNFSGEYPVDRNFVAAGVAVDCISPPPEGQEHTCVVAVGAISDYDQSGYTFVDFDPDTPLQPEPTLTVSPIEGLTDGQKVSVTITNVDPGSDWWISQCDGRTCTQPGYESGTGMFVADESGTVHASFAVVRQVNDGHQESIDCMAPGNECWLEVGGPDYLRSPALVFGGGAVEEAPSAPTTQPSAPTTQPTETTVAGAPTPTTTVVVPDTTDTTSAPTSSTVPSS